MLDTLCARRVMRDVIWLEAMIEAHAHHDEAAAKSMIHFMQSYLEGLRDVILFEVPGIPKSHATLAATLTAAMIEGISTTYEAADVLGLQTEVLSLAAADIAADIARWSMRERL